ncbi:hypothetical protein WJT86_04080 [Microvirga sp. W0021]|uniref:Uncharacterized protein n=1 Tax=Hohaiivirga grylli TaxID=3133970 RepID=A0ABV0BH76_9HYPH
MTNRHKTCLLPTLLGVIILGSACLSAAQAQQVTSQNIPCSQLQTMVRTEGAVTIYYGSHLYDRYVDHAGFCATMERTKAAWIPSKDNPQCFVGYTCEQPHLTSKR